MTNSTPFYFLLVFILFLGYANSQSEPYDQEHVILLKLKEYLQNPSFLSHWTPSNSSHCSWPEIQCSSTTNNGSVIGLYLINTNITQKIPSFLCDLKNLTHIDFQWNFLPGEFPTSLYNCSKLEHLDLSNNYFVGKIPDDIDRLANLQFLNLNGNNFSGDIPASIGRLKELRNLQLSYCQFNGTYPDEIGNLSNLEVLYIYQNRLLLPSKFPSSFIQLKNMKNFHMFESNLIGEIPENIGEMVALEQLDLSINNLTGQIPNGLFMLKNLSILYLFRNNLSGEIPDVVEALNLTILDLSQNNLSGKIPDAFGNLHKLTGLNLGLNKFSGEMPESLGRLPSIIDFGVIFNNLSGTVPPEFGLHSPLRRFEIASNNFTGRLPQNLCYYGNLFRITAYHNKLDGEFPESLGNCSTLIELRINQNELSGNIPSGLWASQNLSTLMINENKLTGELPETLPRNVSLLAISYNQFSGSIPARISSMKNLVVFNASKNLFNGSIPQELTSLSQLTTLLLDRNQFSGSLPSEFISWKSLKELNLSQNQLSGEIPDAIGRLPVLSQLDLSENQFSGQVPAELSHLPITNFNLSSNHLTGRIPSSFENLIYANSFLNNSGLCTDMAGLNVTLCNSGSGSQQQSSKGSSVSLALIIGLAIVAFIAAFLLLLFIIRVYRRRKQELDTSWKLTSFQRLSFTESNIVSSMTDQNIIGRGGHGTVYRVAVALIGYVAVKKICSNRKLAQKLEDAFLAEVEILSSIRHTNIVKLLCCISNGDSMLLVYEYMENRSLDRWLHKKRGSLPAVSGSVPNDVLDWPKRLHIAIGAAQGLSYMHHDNSPPIIHRDVKTSNILLDSMFNAKVADFGLARMMVKPPGELDTMSAVVGSFGYIAPEYAQTKRVNEKVDVYGFGVILLELTTGKEANYGDEHSSLAEWGRRQIQLGSNIEQVLDERIKTPMFLEEMCSVFKLGVLCTAAEPTGRPSMKEVLQILLRLKDPFGYLENHIGHCDVVPLLKNSKRESRVDIDNDS